MWGGGGMCGPILTAIMHLLNLLAFSHTPFWSNPVQLLNKALEGVYSEQSGAPMVPKNVLVSAHTHGC